MRNFILILFLMLGLSSISAQSCDDLADYVKSKSYGSTYNSYSSTAISRVTFYSVLIDYQMHYFAIVCFKNQTYGCTEYIYQVSSSTESNYSYAYLSSAGKAFWSYIEPHSGNLGCAPNFN